MSALPLSNHTPDPTTMCPSPFAAASHTTNVPRCNADDQKMQDVLNEFKPLATMGRPISIPAGGTVEIIDGEIVDEAEVEAVADETILMKYGDDTTLVERIAANRMLPEVLAEVGEIRGGEPEKLGDIAARELAKVAPPMTLEQEQMRAGFDAMINRDETFEGHE